MNGTQHDRLRAEARLWRAMLRGTEADLRLAFSAHDRVRVRSMERELHKIYSQLTALNEAMHALKTAV